MLVDAVVPGEMKMTMIAASRAVRRDVAVALASHRWHLVVVPLQMTTTTSHQHVEFLEVGERAISAVATPLKTITSPAMQEVDVAADVEPVAVEPPVAGVVFPQLERMMSLCRLSNTMNCRSCATSC